MKIRAIAFPLELAGNNLATATDADCVKNAILHVLSIAKGEFLQRPTYGTRKRIFDGVQFVPEILQDIETQLRNQIGADYPTVAFRVSGLMEEGGILQFTVEWELNGIPQPAIALKI